MSRPNLSTKLARRIGIIAAFALIAAMAVPATGSAARVKFGATINPSVQPSNGSPGIQCMTEFCTFVQDDAYGRPGAGMIAPKTGTIKRIKYIAADPGRFRLQVVTVKHSPSTRLGATQAQVTYTGPLELHTGQTEWNYENDRYNVERAHLNIPIKKGQQLALRGDLTSLLRCSSGGHNTLVFGPSLVKGGPFQGATDASGCWLLMEAEIR
ncbi:MAG TPA: hypothetical protein VHR18_04425 [Solirubrobacterales bacterium]|jgi:hypothetical protein|nr:hypothetical protein [Solirubrobacterales bacterium]